ncbi:DDI1 [Candida oxycetoniae]|uniref:DNA damage-inducible protein 1 n=1 Tax=Candida oxycetoniae TaxID=497107 RepID=A0AAI9SX24_9ASCO|nr:DDI1 [Candida oxycetoniae]KAI3404548.2 DDI1 [Candida oxycetoniae]
MQLTISLDFSGDILSVDVPDSLQLEDFKAYLSAETGVELSEQQLSLNGIVLVANKTLAELGVRNNDLLTLSKTSSQGAAFSPSQSSHNQVANSTHAGVVIPPESQINNRIEMIRLQLLADPQALENVKFSQPSLYDSINNPVKFRDLMIEQVRETQRQESSTQAELIRLQQDPDNPENQARILELIQQEAIEENMKLAWDISPESFTSVTMLHIKLKINGIEQIAMVDTGAAMTVISLEIAQKCGISRLIDKRFEGQAVGVGTQKIGGKIHSVPIEIDNTGIELPCSFYIVDTSVGVLFGLDMLRRHRCLIDLNRDVLVIGEHIEAKFLSEAEIPKKSIGNNNLFSRGS